MLGPESADPGAGGQGAAQASYRAYSAWAATPPTGAWAAEFGPERFWTGH